VSADKHIVRLWEANSGKAITSVQPPGGGINDVLLWKDSGLLILACESPKLLVPIAPSSLASIQQHLPADLSCIVPLWYSVVCES
jgi:hypothetical protein